MRRLSGDIQKLLYLVKAAYSSKGYKREGYMAIWAENIIRKILKPKSDQLLTDQLMGMTLEEVLELSGLKMSDLKQDDKFKLEDCETARLEMLKIFDPNFGCNVPN